MGVASTVVNMAANAAAAADAWVVTVVVAWAEAAWAAPVVRRSISAGE